MDMIAIEIRKAESVPPISETVPDVPRKPMYVARYLSRTMKPNGDYKDSWQLTTDCKTPEEAYEEAALLDGKYNYKTYRSTIEIFRIA